MNNENNTKTEEKEVEETVVNNEEQINESTETDSMEEGLSLEEQLQEKVAENEKLKAELDEAKNKVLRAHADFDNLRRRTNKELEDSRKYRSQSLLDDLLPVLDNFERALQVESNDDNTNSILKGMNMVYNQLLEAAKKEGLEEIEAVGKEFDPNFHQAVMQVEDENHESNIVVEELQKGYKLKDRVLRPTMVKVSQ